MVAGFVFSDGRNLSRARFTDSVRRSRYPFRSNAVGFRAPARVAVRDIRRVLWEVPRWRKFLLMPRSGRIGAPRPGLHRGRDDSTHSTSRPNHANPHVLGSDSAIARLIAETVVISPGEPATAGGSTISCKRSAIRCVGRTVKRVRCPRPLLRHQLQPLCFDDLSFPLLANRFGSRKLCGALRVIPKLGPDRIGEIGEIKAGAST